MNRKGDSKSRRAVIIEKVDWLVSVLNCIEVWRINCLELDGTRISEILSVIDILKDELDESKDGQKSLGRIPFIPLDR